MNALCRYFGACGGCDSQDKPYQEQLRSKELHLKQLLSGFDIKTFDDIIPSPEIFHYRNKMEFAVGGDAACPFIGLRQKKKFYKVIDLEECRIFYTGIKRVFDIFKGWMSEHGIEPYQPRRHTGVLRYAAVRHSKRHDELMVIAVVASGDIDTGSLVKGLNGMDNVKSVYLCVNEKLADVAITGNLTLLSGQAKIKEEINGISYLISPDSFFQTNSCCCGRLYGAIKKEAENFGGDALDVCCGSGGITLQVAANFRKVVGVDISGRNIDDAKENARINGIGNVEFIMEDAEKFLLEAVRSKDIGNFSTIIVDPPRAGLSRKGKSAILESGVKNLVYVSCNPANLAGDLKCLCGAYRIDKIIPVDMFPHTRHAEVIAILEVNKV